MAILHLVRPDEPRPIFDPGLACTLLDSAVALDDDPVRVAAALQAAAGAALVRARALGVPQEEAYAAFEGATQKALDVLDIFDARRR